MREIARFYDAEEAQIAAGFLRAQGFEVQLPDEHVLAVRPELRIGLGGYRLLAADGDAFLAKAALDEKRPKPLHAPCPRCESTAIRRTRAWPFPLALLAVFGELFPFAPPKDSLRCGACNLIWKEEDDEPQGEL
jgi:hypothetical protein